MKSLLILGLGDVAKRALPLLHGWRVVAPSRAVFDLDAPDFAALPRDVDALLYTVPPLVGAAVDERLVRLLDFWRQHPTGPAHVVYISTTGVYGDCAGAWLDESCALKPVSARAKLRVNAEQQWRAFARGAGASLTVLRAPGIYGLSRLPLARVRAQTPILLADQDSYSNHIHADDLARLCVAALAQPQGVAHFNACDDAPLLMGDWFCALAAALGWAAPPRMSREQLRQNLSALQWSFVSESRRISNAQIKQALGVDLLYPCALDFLARHALQLKQMGQHVEVLD